MKASLRERLNVKKAARFAVAINAVQIVTVLIVLLYVAFVRQMTDRNVEVGVLLLTLLIVAWGAVLDIREARGAVKVAEQAQMLEEANGQLEALNATLRKQRHDFKNHLQVICTLTELGDKEEVLSYIESLNLDIQRTGSALKTAIPAVNALIAAKKQECADRGIALETDIVSTWQGMPVAGWEMCRVLGNLIDNARDALLEDPAREAPAITLSIGEDAGRYTFRVANNGPAIPQRLRESIFQLGFTTKSEGHGSGLSIVKEILSAAGGGIELESGELLTQFRGWVPKVSAQDSPDDGG